MRNLYVLLLVVLVVAIGGTVFSCGGSFQPKPTEPIEPAEIQRSTSATSVPYEDPNYFWERFGETTSNSRNERFGPMPDAGFLAPYEWMTFGYMDNIHGVPGQGYIKVTFPSSPENPIAPDPIVFERVYSLDESSTLAAYDANDHNLDEFNPIEWAANLSHIPGNFNMSSVAVSGPGTVGLPSPFNVAGAYPMLVYAISDGGNLTILRDSVDDTGFGSPAIDFVYDKAAGDPGHVISSPVVIGGGTIHSAYYVRPNADGISTNLWRVIVQTTKSGPPRIDWEFSIDHNGPPEDPNPLVDGHPGLIDSTPVFNGTEDRIFLVVRDADFPNTATLQSFGLSWGMVGSSNPLNPFNYYEKFTSVENTYLASPVWDSTRHKTGFPTSTGEVFVTTPDEILAFADDTLERALISTNPDVFYSIPASVNTKFYSQPVMEKIAYGLGVQHHAIFVVENNPPGSPGGGIAGRWRVVAHWDNSVGSTYPLDSTPEWYSAWIDGQCFSQPFFSGEMNADTSTYSIWVTDESRLYAFKFLAPFTELWRTDLGGTPYSYRSDPFDTDNRSSISLTAHEIPADRKIFVGGSFNNSGRLYCFSSGVRQQHTPEIPEYWTQAGNEASRRHFSPLSTSAFSRVGEITSIVAPTAVPTEGKEGFFQQDIVVGPDGNTYYTDGEGRVIKTDTDGISGDSSWEYFCDPGNGDPIWSSSPAIVGNTLYYYIYSNTNSYDQSWLHAIDITSSAPVWKDGFGFAAPFYLGITADRHSPTVGPDGRIYTTGYEITLDKRVAHTLYVIEPEDGTSQPTVIESSLVMDGWFPSDIVVDSSNRAHFTLAQPGAFGCRYYVFDPDDATSWPDPLGVSIDLAIPSGNGCKAIPPVIGDNGEVFINTMETIYGFDLDDVTDDDWEPEWNYDTDPGLYWFRSNMALGNDDRLYFNDYSIVDHISRIIAIDTSDPGGGEVWTSNEFFSVETSFALSADGWISIATMDGLYAFDTNYLSYSTTTPLFIPHYPIPYVSGTLMPLRVSISTVPGYPSSNGGTVIYGWINPSTEENELLFFN